MVNPSEQPSHYGVAGFLDRYEGENWERFAHFGASLDFWDGLVRVAAPGDRLPVAAIGLGAPAFGIGNGEYLAIDKLDPGQYRVGHRESGYHGYSREVVGEFTVAAGPAGDAVPIEVGSPVGVLLLSPFLISPHGGRLGVRRQEPLRTGVSTPDTRVGFSAGLSDTVEVQKWSEQRWSEPVFVAEIRTVPVPEFNTTETFVELPALAPGAYRFVCEHTSGHLTRVAWVVDGLPT